MNMSSGQRRSRTSAASGHSWQRNIYTDFFSRRHHMESAAAEKKSPAGLNTSSQLAFIKPVVSLPRPDDRTSIQARHSLRNVLNEFHIPAPLLSAIMFQALTASVANALLRLHLSDISAAMLKCFAESIVGLFGVALPVRTCPKTRLPLPPEHSWQCRPGEPSSNCHIVAVKCMYPLSLSQDAQRLRSQSWHTARVSSSAH